MTEGVSIAERVRRIRGEIAEAAIRSGRDPGAVTLVAVSKTRTAAEVDEAIRAGVVHFGENRVQEASAKIPVTTAGAVWHLVGHLQSNKVKVAAGLFDWIDSMDSPKTADLLSERAIAMGWTFRVLIQVNISEEDAKSGVAPENAADLAQYVATREGLKVQGLMTIGSLGANPEVTRGEFARMHELFERLRGSTDAGPSMTELSMGMSGDYVTAVEEGATMVRIGTAIFGERER